MKYSLILLAAGRGTRTLLDYNKVFYHLTPETTVLDASLRLFEKDPDCSQMIVVCAPHELKQVQKEYGSYRKMECISGGETRQESVWKGLEKVREDTVLIHDGARPYLSRDCLESLKGAMDYEQAALLMVPSVDTVKLVDENGYILETPDRRRVYNAQTPQAFKTRLIKQVHEKAREKQYTGTDDASLVEKFSSALVACVPGDPNNVKITNPSDLTGMKEMERD